MPDKLDAPASKIAKDINTPKVDSREEATNLLLHANPADIKNLADKVTASIDMHALGLDGFHLAQDKPAGKIPIKAEDSEDHKAHSISALKFTSADGKQNVLLLPNGAEYDMATSKQLRPSDTAVAPAAPPADAPPAAKPGDTPPAATKPGDTPPAPAKPGDAPPAPGAPAQPGDTTSDADKAKVLQRIQQKVDEESLSDPVKKGEGYYQVLKRMHPEMTPEDAVKQARHMRELNGQNVNLKVGDRLPLKSDDEKKAQVQAALDQFNALAPADKAAAVAAAKTAFPDAPAGTPPAPADAPPAATKPGDTPPPAPGTPAPADTPPAATKPGDTPPAPGTPAPADTPPATKPGDTPPAPGTPAPADTPPAAPKPGDTPPPAAPPDAPVAWAPKIDPAGADLNPKGDPKKPETLAYNPMAPIGLTEGQAGKALSTATGGVHDREITAGKDGKSETIQGKLDDATWLSAWLDKTGFKTNDTLQDGKLSGRITQYDSGVDMKFQGPAGQDAIAIKGVTKVQTVMDAGNHGYTTAVTDSNNKTYTFTSDEQGVVTGYQAPGS